MRTKQRTLRRLRNTVLPVLLAFLTAVTVLLSACGDAAAPESGSIHENADRASSAAEAVSSTDPDEGNSGEPDLSEETDGLSDAEPESPESVADDSDEPVSGTGSVEEPNSDTEQSEDEDSAEPVSEEDSLDESKPEHVHSFVKTAEKEPTCTEEGTVTYVCEECNEKKVEKSKALGHDYGDWTVTREATCAKEGEQTRTCSRCGSAERKEIEKTEHDWSDGESVMMDAYRCIRSVQSVCKVCGAKSNGDLTVAHDFKTVSQPPTA